MVSAVTVCIADAFIVLVAVSCCCAGVVHAKILNCGSNSFGSLPSEVSPSLSLR